MKNQVLVLVMASSLFLGGCAKKIEEAPPSFEETTLADESEIESEADNYIYSGNENSTDSGAEEYLAEEQSSSGNVSDRSNCTGSETMYTCVDPNNGNTYEITKYGNTTEVQGSSLSGSTWSQTSETIGNTTYTTGYDKDGNEWNQTGEKIGDTYYYNGTDSDGNAFSGSCDSYSGCSKDY
ncbi:hypothetical protein [Acinetobacter sp. YH01024]|uniref:hypothetical protein n=1 Tax=Acinetobacter sp. YH01024 TaxID=2601037 RepID=UPI001C555E28|nr:hypothetical protein [Acinetobacter sp. YH01024]